MSGILIVEDDGNEILRIETFLTQEGYKVQDTISNVSKVYSRALQNDISLIIMDIHLKDKQKDISGIELAKKIRKQKDIPIIFITADKEKMVMKKIKNINNSTFVSKPWHEIELLFHIEKFLDIDSIIELDKEFKYNKKTKELLLNGKIVKLNKKEKDLLELFLNNKNTLLLNETIEHHIWTEPIKDITRISLVSKLRKKLKRKFIVNYSKEGYMFEIKL